MPGKPAKLKVLFSSILETRPSSFIELIVVAFFVSVIWLPHRQAEPLLRRQPRSLNVNHCIFHFRPEGHQEPYNKVGYLSLAEHLLGFEPGTFRFWLQYLNPLGHSPLKYWFWILVLVNFALINLDKNSLRYISSGKIAVGHPQIIP